MTEAYFFSLVVTVSSWLTPLPQHAAGKLVYYGPQYLSEANADYRGYDLSPYWNRCGVAVMSPADLGRMVWVRKPGGEWLGPCLAVDVAARIHFARAVWYVGEIVDVPKSVRDALGFEFGMPGEAWIGQCPQEGEAQAYDPPKVFVDEVGPNPNFVYPPQELPASCGP